MHLVLALDGELRIRSGARGRWQRAAGVLTAPDVAHALDAEGRDTLLVFLDPESQAGAALRSTFEGPYRLLDAAERDLLGQGADPLRIMQADGVAWTRDVVETLGAAAPKPARIVHPRVRKLLRHLQTLPPGADTSLDALGAAVGLSSGRLMHAFTESIGIPIRPYLAWLKVQRATLAIVTGQPLARAAQFAGFSDAAHMTRSFRRMLGMTPSVLVRARQPADPRPEARGRPQRGT